MLANIISLLTKRLAETGKFAKVNGIVELIRETNIADPTKKRKFPAFYEGKDSYSHVTKFDYKTGVCFFIRGNSSNTIEESKRACSTYINAIYRPTLYVIAKREEKDSLDKMILLLSKLLVINNGADERIETDSNYISGTFGNMVTDHDSVTRDIFENFDIPNRHDLMFIKVELSYEQKYYMDCVTISCD